MNYVVVLIDGDCMPVSPSYQHDAWLALLTGIKFVNELLAAGEPGGHQASRLLKASVIEYLRTKHSEVPANVKITIRVYANFKGLARAYCDAQVIGNPTELGNFVNGFNKEDALCDFVNAGDGKECADEKLKGMSGCHVSPRGGCKVHANEPSCLPDELRQRPVPSHCLRGQCR